MGIETLRPNGAGDETGLEPTGDPDINWECVDEEVSDGDTSRVANNVTHELQRDLYNLPASSGAGTINKITVYINCKFTGGGAVDGWAKASIKSNATVTDGAEKYPPSGSYELFSQDWATNPADSQAWEWSDIDALQIGVAIYEETSFEQIRCTQVYVEVDYTAPPVEQAVGGGAVGIAGSLNRKTSKAVGSGSVGMAGTLLGFLKFFQNVGGGAIGMAGSLGRTIKLAVGEGSIAIAGTLNRLTKRAVGEGSIAIAGSLSSIKRMFQAVGGGSVAIAGSLNRKMYIAVGEGAITFAGAIGVLIRKAVGGGAVAIAGALVRLPKIGVGQGAVAIAGTLGRKIYLAVGGGSVAIASVLVWSWLKKKIRLVPFAYSRRKTGEGEK